MYKEKEGWLVPKVDQVGFNMIKLETKRLAESTALCSHHRVAVQAGGNVGLFPFSLSKVFDEVYTFEPAPDNYHCMEHNLSSRDNIKLYPYALGSAIGTASLYNYRPENIGTHQIREDGNDFKVVTIDSLNLEHVNFIQLDIEGYEYQALEGAKETIREYRPVLHIEMNGRGEDFDHTDSGTHRYILSLGYDHHCTLGKDFIFIAK